jgi:hypothetical protein
MRIFISWSGQQSRLVAEVLRDWFPNVIQAVQPWMSAADIEKGARWSLDIAQQLDQTQVGVICLTPSNIEAPWILFESGALSKTLDKSFVCTYLFGVKPEDLKGPLVQFQATLATEKDTRKLAHTVNRAMGDSGLNENRINKAFDVWWPQLNERLASISDNEEQPVPIRSERELLTEILDLVRTQTKLHLPFGTQEFQTAAFKLLRKQLAKDYEKAVNEDNIGSMLEVSEAMSLNKFLSQADHTGLAELREYQGLSREAIRQLLQIALDRYDPSDETFCEIIKVVLKQSSQRKPVNGKEIDKSD